MDYIHKQKETPQQLTTQQAENCSKIGNKDHKQHFNFDHSQIVNLTPNKSLSPKLPAKKIKPNKNPSRRLQNKEQPKKQKNEPKSIKLIPKFFSYITRTIQ